jgi:nicotinamide phosphoribosyltransferase
VNGEDLKMETRTHDNIILLTDSYKLSHYKQYPKDAENIFSYFESRKGAKFPYTVFFGLQYFIKRYLEGTVVTQEKIDQAESIARLHLGEFNKEGWEYILEKHRGKLPIKIRAVPEGSVIPTGNVLMTVQATDPKCKWLVNYLETLLVEVWYPSTVATISRSVKETIKGGMLATGADLQGLPFKLHDFGFRGSTCPEAAGLGGLAHLVNFQGTDTLPALGLGMQFYGAGMSGFSILASEHSTITSWGEENELEAFKNMLEQYLTGLVACVSDSYDIDRACSEYWGKELKDNILKREGTLVVRPDSGEIVPMVMNVLTRLGDAFGTTLNEDGFKVLPDQVRVIQGDGCTPETIMEVVNMMHLKGWSLDNIAFGMGGGLLQKLDRDTQRFAFKCSAIQREGEWQDVYKQPKSDPTKNSKRGLLELVKNSYGQYETLRKEDVCVADEEVIMKTVFENGELLINDTFDEIRKRAKA